MFVPPTTVDLKNYIRTAHENLVSKEAIIFRPENVELPGGKASLHEPFFKCDGDSRDADRH
jgi:hypothetical protein